MCYLIADTDKCFYFGKMRGIVMVKEKAKKEEPKKSNEELLLEEILKEIKKDEK